jgi:SAM-dependent methyltransferase
MALLSKYLSKTRFAKLLPYIEGDLLDIGCQRGQLRTMAAGQIGEYTGIDISEDAILEARSLHPDAKFYAMNIDEEPLTFVDKFDTIIMSAVIEHIFNLGILGKGLSRALRPGGRFIFTTPTPFGNDVVHRFGATLGIFSRVAADDHIVIFNKKRCEIFAQEFKLILVEYRTFQFGCNQLAVLEKPK